MQAITVILRVWSKPEESCLPPLLYDAGLSRDITKNARLTLKPHSQDQGRDSRGVAWLAQVPIESLCHQQPAHSLFTPHLRKRI